MTATKLRSRSNRLIAAFVATSLAVLFGTGTVAANAQEPTAEQCLDAAICPIPYVRLAKQETEPFLFLGKVVDEKHPRYEDYRKALSSFPDVRSCLTEHERGKPQPDLRQMDWDAIRNIADIDTCVFRIASSIEDVESIRLWLQYHGFKVGKARWAVTPNYSPKYDTDPVLGFQSHLTVEKFREVLPQSWFATTIGFELMRNYWLNVLFDQSGQVVGVSSGGNSILN